MPIYEYKCEECEHLTDVYSDIDKRKESIKCEKCGRIAKRTYSIGGAFLKKVRVEDVWRANGINPDERGETADRKRRNSKRIKKMREEDARKKGKA